MTPIPPSSTDATTDIASSIEGKPAPAISAAPSALEKAAEVQLYLDVNDAPEPVGGEVERVPFGQQFAALLIIILPFIGLAAAIINLWGSGFTWLHAGLLLGGYILTGMGITVGYHRYFTHKSFETTRPIKAIMGILGTMAFEGPVLRWVATHRIHHRHSDREGDPHTPHEHGEGLKGLLHGALHAHMGWIMDPPISQATLDKYVPDLLKDPTTVWVSKHATLWAVLGLLIPAAIAGAVTGTLSGAVMGFVWGGLVRVLVVHHITWSINSACHLWGARPYRTSDESRDNPIFGILGFGEGWHNTHHAFPASARHGLAWWKIDTSYYLIVLLRTARLAWDVRTPDPERVEAKRRTKTPAVVMESKPEPTSDAA